MPGMWRLGGHLGSAVSALVDGQLDDETAERAWAHVMTCPSCRRLVEREGWVKRQLAEMAGATPEVAPSDLLGSLYDLEPRPDSDPVHVRDAWAAVERLEHRSRARRRSGLAAVGVGSVSAAVLGLSTLGGAPLGIGGAPASPPATSLTRTTPTSTSTTAPAVPSPTTGPFSGWQLRSPSESASRALPVRSSR
jgi:hypothetical protein